jgi:poly [ADP-ribose] polymerase
MAPRAFHQFVITLSGTFSGYKQGEFRLNPGELTPRSRSSTRGDGRDSDDLAADVKALVEEQGATFSTSVTDLCTHLITTQKEVDKNTMKCESLHLDTESWH